VCVVRPVELLRRRSISSCPWLAYKGWSSWHRSIHHPLLRATVQLHVAYNHQESCPVAPPSKHASSHSNAIEGEEASRWHRPASSAYKRARRGALLHHPATCSARSLARLLSLRFASRIPYTAVRTSRARSSSQTEVSGS
jgi:hypothetical protein